MAGNLAPLYIFDMDGTLANCQHRVHLLEGSGGARWDEFYSLVSLDTPIWPVIDTMERLKQSGAQIWIFSGRRESTREDTITWLGWHTSLTPDELECGLTMRRNGDGRDDAEVKQEFVKNMLDVDRERLVAVFDDRQRVVDMWRTMGIPCFQVAPGDF